MEYGAQTPRDDEPSEPLISGLDAEHSRMLRALESASTWSIDGFDHLAQGHGLMPAGALEALNDAAFDSCGDALLEGDDPIEVNDAVWQEMLT